MHDDPAAESEASETAQLQRGINDLVSVLSLPAVWTGNDPAFVAMTLLDALVQMLRLDFVYLRAWPDPEHSTEEWARLAKRSALGDEARELGQALEPYLRDAPSEKACSIPGVCGGDVVSLVVLPLGLDSPVAATAGGCARAD